MDDMTSIEITINGSTKVIRTARKIDITWDFMIRVLRDGAARPDAFAVTDGGFRHTYNTDMGVYNVYSSTSPYDESHF